jgi:hypothetical protein
MRVNDAQNEPIRIAGRSSMSRSNAAPVPSAIGMTEVSRPNPPEMTRNRTNASMSSCRPARKIR